MPAKPAAPVSRTSTEDREVTRQLRTAGRTLGIDVLDHVIIGEGRYTSFVEKGIWDAL